MFKMNKYLTSLYTKVWVVPLSHVSSLNMSTCTVSAYAVARIGKGKMNKIFYCVHLLPQFLAIPSPKTREMVPIKLNHLITKFFRLGKSWKRYWECLFPGTSDCFFLAIKDWRSHGNDHTKTGKCLLTVTSAR